MDIPTSFPEATVSHLNALISVCTHSALDVSEGKIFDGVSLVPLRTDFNDTMRIVKPYNRRLSHARDRSGQRVETHGQMYRNTFPFWLKTPNKPSLKFCTFGSLWRALNENKKS